MQVNLKACNKFIGISMFTQLHHILSEIGEVREAITKNVQADIAEEIVDAMTALETLRVGLRVSDEEMETACEKVIAKNGARNYYERG